MTFQSGSYCGPVIAHMSSICSCLRADKSDAWNAEPVQNQSRNRSASTPRSHCSQPPKSHKVITLMTNLHTRNPSCKPIAKSFDGISTEELVNSLDWLLRCQIKDQSKATMLVAHRMFDAIVERIG